MLQQLAIPLANLPLQLVLISNGTIAIVPNGSFPVIIDNPDKSLFPDGISAIITDTGMLVGSTEVPYGKSLQYKNAPELIKWLVQQELESPM